MGITDRKDAQTRASFSFMLIHHLLSEFDSFYRFDIVRVMKTVLFIPGSGEDIDSRDYRSTIKAIEASGYNVQFVSITWPRTNINSWVKELEAEYDKHDPAQTILAGFSFGAMTAFVAASHRNPAELWLFSLSPYFAEDILSKQRKQAWLDALGPRRVNAFRKINFKQLAQRVQCKTLLFYGRKELEDWPIMNERSIGAHELLNDNKLIVIDEVGHDVADELYIQAIASQLG